MVDCNRGRFISWEVSAIFCGRLRVRVLLTPKCNNGVPEWSPKRLKVTQLGAHIDKRVSKRDLKTVRGSSKGSPAGKERKGEPKGRYHHSFSGILFGQTSMNNAIDNSFKNQSRFVFDNCARRLRTKVMPKSMPETSKNQWGKGNHDKSGFSEKAETWFWADNIIVLFKNKVHEVW